jgi:hypothetical protein
MVKQFQEEGRGEDWVSAEGELVQRAQSTTLGPNYPCL